MKIFTLKSYKESFNEIYVRHKDVIISICNFPVVVCGKRPQLIYLQN